MRVILRLGCFRRSPTTSWQIVKLFWFTNESALFFEEQSSRRSSERKNRFSSKQKPQNYVHQGYKGEKDANPPQDDLKK